MNHNIFKLWLDALQFLLNNEPTWEINETLERSKATTTSPQTTPLINSSRFSNWFRLVRHTARVMFFDGSMKGNCKRPANLEDLEKAKLLLYQQSQQETFFENYNQLQTKQQVVTFSRQRYFSRAKLTFTRRSKASDNSKHKETNCSQQPTTMFCHHWAPKNTQTNKT